MLIDSTSDLNLSERKSKVAMMGVVHPAAQGGQKEVPEIIGNPRDSPGIIDRVLGRLPLACLRTSAASTMHNSMTGTSLIVTRACCEIHVSCELCMIQHGLRPLAPMPQAAICTGATTALPLLNVYRHLRQRRKRGSLPLQLGA